MTSIKIGQRSIGAGSVPFIIAEMSGNHNQSLEVALQIVEAAAKAGAHALKLQTYTADTMTLNLDHGEFFIKDPDSLWAGSSLYTLYEKAHTPWEWHAPIFARAKALGMLAFSTPFDESAVDFLESLEVPAYKIASFENTDLPLIRRVATTGKPMIMSTGMASVAELDESVRAARAAGCKDLILLKCTSTYPASPVNSHLRTIPHLRELFGCEVGLSDHSMGVGVSVAAVALGATVIEKHFTLDRSAGGVDASFSLEPAELASLVVETKRAWQAMGQVHYGVTEAERKSLVYRRSLYVTQDMEAGELFSADNLRAIRPGLGLAPKHSDAVIGRRAKHGLKRGTPLDWSMVE
ncbi:MULTISPECIES: pseudaminic acid synthase [unclassified Pseudomonas]|uniref:pseudaminic acid synthase n=1 Tax=unclassified Pseudomonas TaxID=196821 RepID=UPI002B2371FE|nr:MULTISPECIES: pseudaminic acid synthase [unclassified Pseudomonas]MEA9978122.1 pseudaminic acid synthase [Pseudomonas sp. RTS4]MEB0199771.1 pseudaminic acid synthase [Pseudomonas sp. 5S4]MEB0244130.1 pseudaminic acid synthase [Pseudomonas sp. 10S5]